MKKISTLIFVVGSLLLVTGCKEEVKPDIVQTVDWYKENQAEREDVLKKCSNNPGELAATPNCVNASRAENSLTWSKRGSIQVKPMTAEELKQRRQ
jgi:hypothetical protein